MPHVEKTSLKLSNAKNVLVLAVGGGNDSVSTLLLQLQLNKSFNYSPGSIDIAAMLPDCLDYQDLEPITDCLNVSIINPNTTRSVQGFQMKAFPEKILAQNKSVFPELPIQNIFGISMTNGSIGTYLALKSLIENAYNKGAAYDMVLAVDVGGDFVAHKDNYGVLSPMMDGYMLYALKRLLTAKDSLNVPFPQFLFSIFGLGTDGESTPEMLEKAIALLPSVSQHTFIEKDISKFIDFYRTAVEPNRYSRTTDYTLQEIEYISGVKDSCHENPSLFRGRFHIQTRKERSSPVRFGSYLHEQNAAYFGKFYLFDNISNVINIFSNECDSGINWFLNVQKKAGEFGIKPNHELNGQAYMDLITIFKDSPELKNISLFFGTPSGLFDDKQQLNIIEDVLLSIKNGVYNMAFVYTENIAKVENIEKLTDLFVIALNDTDLPDAHLLEHISLVCLNTTTATHLLSKLLTNLERNIRV